MGGRGGSSGLYHIDADAENAAEYYISGDGMWINQYLRGNIDDPGFVFTEQDAEYLRDLDKATNVTLQNIDTLYRSVDAAAIFGKLSAIDYENLQSGLVYGDSKALQRVQRLINQTSGKTITEKGFLSTTKDATIAHEWGSFSGSSMPVVVEYKVPKGTKGKDLSKHYMAQDEVLLSRKQKYKVHSVSAKNGNIYVKAEILK